MKRILILSLILLLLLCSCGKAEETTKAVSTEITQTEDSLATDVSTETPPEQPTEPTMPSVITANSIEKDAIFDNGAWTFTQSVKYPKIDSDKDGAKALNKDIADKYEKIIEEINSDADSGLLYTVDYNHSAANGIIFINIEGYIGLYGSEGYYTRNIYYYDVENDKSTTPEEYAARAEIDLEKAKENILYSADLAAEYLEDTAVAVDGSRSEVTSIEKGKIYPARQSKFDYIFNGLEVVENEVHMYCQGQEYILLNLDFVLDKATLMPINSHYICELPTDATDTDTFAFTFENGVLVDYSIPKRCGIRAINLSSREISIDSTRTFDDISISVNGGEKEYIGSWWSLDDGVLYSAYLDDYIAPEEIRTIEFFDFEPRVDVIPSETYTKKAIDIFGGDIDYTHSVTYPIIDSDAPGATALNAKISEKYENVIAKLKTNKEENELYNISYHSSEWYGVFFIAIYENTGWQYSEGSSNIKIYYYDSENDRELTKEEYLARFEIDLEMANEGVLTSDELFRSMLYDESKPNVLSETIFGAEVEEISPYRVYYSKAQSFNDTVKFIGAEVHYGEVYMYYTGSYYVHSILRVPLDKRDLTPVHPHYEARVKTAAHQITYDEKCVEIIFNGENVENVIRNTDNSIAYVYVMSDMIKLRSDARLDKVKITVNGEEISNGYSSYGDESGFFIYDYYLEDYCPIGELKTVKITIEQ